MFTTAKEKVSTFFVSFLAARKSPLPGRTSDDALHFCRRGVAAASLRGSGARISFFVFNSLSFFVRIVSAPLFFFSFSFALSKNDVGGIAAFLHIRRRASGERSFSCRCLINLYMKRLHSIAISENGKRRGWRARKSQGEERKKKLICRRDFVCWPSKKKKKKT